MQQVTILFFGDDAEQAKEKLFNFLGFPNNDSSFVQGWYEQKLEQADIKAVVKVDGDVIKVMT